MEPYKNLNGNSTVISYEIAEDSIHVVFKTGAQRNYLYNHDRPGKDVVDRLKVLAKQGHGLNSYLTRIVKSNYANKW